MVGSHLVWGQSTTYYNLSETNCQNTGPFTPQSLLRVIEPEVSFPKPVVDPTECPITYPNREIIPVPTLDCGGRVRLRTLETVPDLFKVETLSSYRCRRHPDSTRTPNGTLHLTVLRSSWERGL